KRFLNVDKYKSTLTLNEAPTGRGNCSLNLGSGNVFNVPVYNGKTTSFTIKVNNILAAGTSGVLTINYDALGEIKRFNISHAEHGSIAILQDYLYDNLDFTDFIKSRDSDNNIVFTYKKPAYIPVNISITQATNVNAVSVTTNDTGENTDHP